VATVTEAERLLIAKVQYPGLYRCVARYGWRDEVHMGLQFTAALLKKVQ
jgi:hypothetical protein